MLKLRKFLMKIEDYIISDRVNAVIKFCKLMLVIIFIAHWIACFFFYVGASEVSSNG